MGSNVTRLILASRSPRRGELLRQIGVAHECCAADIDETPNADEPPLDYVRRMAQEKALRVNQRLLAGELVDCGGSLQKLAVLAADTIVFTPERIMGKPNDEAEAYAMLRCLSGQTHQVATAVALVARAAEAPICDVLVSKSRVQFKSLSDAEIHAYCATGEPFDKAGAYAIQGAAAMFIEKIEGSYSGIMGLPLCETAHLLRKASVATTLDAPVN